MANLFREYAQYYDLLYQDKDYSEESRFVSRLLDLHVRKPIKETTILDLACGTGRHALELAQLGYAMECSDLSTDMVDVARESAERQRLTIRFYTESFQTCNQIGQKYDAVIAMFAAINYLTDYKDLTQSLSNIRELLGENGVFIFDYWNGNAVVTSHSPTRVKRVDMEDRTLIRISNTSLDRMSQIATVRFDFILLMAGRIIREFSETHLIRYFFPREMKDLLLANGFEIVHSCPFLAEKDSALPDDWNVTHVVRPCR